MKTSFKRAAAWLLTVLMILSCVPALATGDVTDLMNGVVDLSNVVSTYDVDGDVSLLSIGEQDSITLTVGESKTVTSTVTSNVNDKHKESWSTSNAAVATVTGNPNTDDNKKQSSATITAVSEGTATITHTYYTSAIWGLYWDQHTETITVNVTAKKYTVSFSIGEEATKAGLSAPDSRTVNGGSVISDLPTMAWDNPDGSPVKVFGGWYSDPAFTTAFTSDTPVNADTTLYAKWLDRYTVSFNVGEEATADGVATPESVTVTEGETVSNLPMPEWKDADGFKKIFAGWYSDEALTTEFTETTPMTADTTILYAKWVEPDAEGMYYVNFYSQDGQTVHLTIAVAAEKTVRPANGPTLEGKVFKGWSTTKQDQSPASALETVAFDFNTPVSNAVADGNTLNLYAWYAEQVTVRFVSYGGMAVPTQILGKGDMATEVTPTRVGYTFGGWYTDEALTTAFDFTVPVDEDITLYAKWTANMVPVTLVYMYENADDAEYSPAGVSEVVYAPAGSYVSIEKSTITAIGQTHNVRYSDTEGGVLTGYASTAATDGQNAKIQDVRDTYFQYNSATNNRQVMPDGSTVMLVYYNRARITLTFEYDQSDTTASIDYQNLISAENRDKYDVNYTQTTTSQFTYSFTAKYRQDITAVWPQIAWVKDNSGNTPSYNSWYTTYTFYSWECPDGHYQTSNMYTLEASLFGTMKIVDGVLVGEGKSEDLFEDVGEDWLIYARTTLPGETVDFIYGGKNYTIYTEACQLGYTGGNAFGYKALDGCTPYDENLKLRTTYGSTMSISNLTVNGTLKEKYDAVFKDEVAAKTLSNDDLCQVLLYDRNTVKLSVWANDTAHPAGSDPQTQSYLYGDWIYNDDNDLLKTLERNMVKEGYIFAGWFTDPDFTPGTEYTLDENTRIIGNLDLYAKWEPNQFLAEYYLYMDDTTPYAIQGFAEGENIDNKFVPAAVQEQFEGWYWYQNGKLVPFDFTSTVGAAHVDENGVLKLYAKWKGTDGKVSYLPGIGGDNTKQEQFHLNENGEELKFKINEAAVQLRKPSDVWTDGSVPTDTSLTFVGWKAPNGKIYQPGRYVLITRQLMQFEAQWSRDAVTLIYNANGGTGANVTETWAKDSVVDIWDNMDANTPHFTREGYELIGWDTNKDATEPSYTLGQGTITLTETETTLYAIWKRTTTSATIKKTVSGNFGDQQRDFTFKVKVVDANSSPVDVEGMSYGNDGYYTFTLKHNGTQQLDNLPIGAKLYFHEENYGNYTQTVNQGELTITSKVGDDYVVEITDGMAQIDFVNTYDVTPDTGVVLDSLPYIVILAIVLLGVVLMVRKRRREDD